MLKLRAHIRVCTPPFCTWIFKKKRGGYDPTQIWKGGGKQSLRTARKTCVSLVLHFACFVFASVFISDGEPGRVCQVPVSMQAIISAPFEVCACVWARMHVCVHCGIAACRMDENTDMRPMAKGSPAKARSGLNECLLRGSGRFTALRWKTHDTVREFPSEPTQKRPVDGTGGPYCVLVVVVVLLWQ